MRTKIVAGNWKMNKTLAEAVVLAVDIDKHLQDSPLKAYQEVVICPPFPFLASVQDALSSSKDTGLKLGAQNCHEKDAGAFTGEVAAPMLKSLGVSDVIIGHSERRAYFGESNELLRAKVDKALQYGLRVIFCCGENLSLRKEEKHFDWIATQIQESLFHLSVEMFSQIVIAYEPIWAIGTGVTASPEQAEEIHAYIRGLIAEKYGEETAENTTVLYGGSCKPNNAKALFSNPNVDGGLIGGASLKASDFVAIVQHL